jgi:hypothetical protein
MNTFTTKIKLEKTPLILQGIDEFLGKLVKITISEITPQKKNHKRQWKMFGTANTGQTLEGINLRDLAYD